MCTIITKYKIFSKRAPAMLHTVRYTNFYNIPRLHMFSLGQYEHFLMFQLPLCKMANSNSFILLKLQGTALPRPIKSILTVFMFVSVLSINVVYSAAFAVP